MLVSSYGPVYGILEDDARHVYVADAVNYNDAYYDVAAAGSNAPRDNDVSEDVRSRDLGADQGRGEGVAHGLPRRGRGGGAGGGAGGGGAGAQGDVTRGVRSARRT